MISLFGVWNCKISIFGLWRSTREQNSTRRICRLESECLQKPFSFTHGSILGQLALLREHLRIELIICRTTHIRYADDQFFIANREKQGSQQLRVSKNVLVEWKVG